MKLQEAKSEFEIRLYYSGKAELERELSESFPSLRLCKTGGLADYRDFVSALPVDEKHRFAFSFQRWRYREALLAKGETINPDDDDVYTRLRACPRSLEKFIQELNQKKKEGEKVKFARKTTIRKQMSRHFVKAFGSRCVGLETLVSAPELSFTIPFGNWAIATSFLWGRWESEIEYTQAVIDREKVDQYGNPSVVGYGISWASWLGISGGTNWLYVTDNEVEPICQQVIDLCGRFFDAAPRLLKGLELD